MCLQAALRDVASGKRLLEGVQFPPSSFDHVQPPTDPALLHDEAAWQASIARAQAAVEAQTLRSINVELASKFSVEQWKAHTDSLAQAEENARKRVQRIQDEIRKVEETRKATQERAKPSLQTYAKRKFAAISSIGQVAPAVADAEAEVRRLKRIARANGLIPDDSDDENGGNNDKPATMA